MLLDAAQLQRYDEDGFLLLPGLFPVAEIDLLQQQLPDLFAEHCADRKPHRQCLDA